jgi:hypothetical protein
MCGCIDFAKHMSMNVSVIATLCSPTNGIHQPRNKIETLTNN